MKSSIPEFSKLHMEKLLNSILLPDKVSTAFTPLLPTISRVTNKKVFQLKISAFNLHVTSKVLQVKTLTGKYSCPSQVGTEKEHSKGQIWGRDRVEGPGPRRQVSGPCSKCNLEGEDSIRLSWFSNISHLHFPTYSHGSEPRFTS